MCVLVQSQAVLQEKTNVLMHRQKLVGLNSGGRPAGMSHTLHMSTHQCFSLSKNVLRHLQYAALTFIDTLFAHWHIKLMPVHALATANRR
jgi:hypothetical protein